MKEIVADVNIAGQVRELIETFYESEDWIEMWNTLGIQLQVFANLGLNQRSPDDLVWQTCQDNELILITGNRNHDGPSSLEATIRERLRPSSLPVIIVSRPKSLGSNSTYTSQVGIKFLEYLLDIDNFRGIGRLYVP